MILTSFWQKLQKKKKYNNKKCIFAGYCKLKYDNYGPIFKCKIYGKYEEKITKKLDPEVKI